MPKSAIEAYMRRLQRRKSEMKLMLYEVFGAVMSKDGHKFVKHWEKKALGTETKPRKANKANYAQLGIGVEGRL